jgi:hypothetical protein
MRAVLTVLLCALACVPVAHAQESTPPVDSQETADVEHFDVIYNGAVGDQRIVAFAVNRAYYIGDLIDDMRPYATPETTLIAYINHEVVSEAEPAVVYVDGENVLFAENPRFSTEPPTFSDWMDRARIVDRGERNGAICRDGSTTEVTNNGACSFNGGVDRWTYEAVTTTDALRVIAAICEDYRLVAGEGERCGESGVLAQIKARMYPQHTPAPAQPAEAEDEPEVPTERPVAPLPEPALTPPTVKDSRVEWTDRHGGEVGFRWTTSLANPNPQPVRAVVTANLRDAEGEIIHTDERIIALEAGEEGEFTDDGAVGEELALQGRRWTFDVTLTDDDAPLTAIEASSVQLVVDPVAEEARITNISEEALDLHGWTLTSTVGGQSFTFRFFTLGPGETVTLTSGDGARSVLPEIYLWTSREVWVDQGDAAELRDAQGRLRARTNADGTAASLDGGIGRRASR